MASLLDAAYHYRDRYGWSPIPVSRVSKQPKLGKGYLETYSQRLPTDEELQAWFENSNGDVAIGVITPPGVVAIDVDDKRLWSLISRLAPQEKAKQTLVHSTPRGYRVFAKISEGIISKKVETRFPGDHRGIELKPGGLGYSVVPPCQGYESLSTWDQPLQVLNRDQAETLVETIKLYGRFANLIDSLASVWIEGARHGLAGALAGCLRKAGLKQAEAETIVEAIASLANDAEIEDRLRYVRDTFEKPVDQVAGISKLREILISLIGEAEAERIVGSLKPKTLEEAGETGLEKFSAKQFAERILEKYRIISIGDDNDDIFVYSESQGIYVPGKQIISGEILNMLGDDNTVYRQNEILAVIRIKTFRERQDPPLHLIPLANGILDLNTFELMPFTPDLIFFSKLPVAYDSNAKCPNIEKFLSEIVRPEDIPLLHEIFGFCLYRRYFLNVAFMLVGDGRNGKSTLLNLLTAFLGRENVSRVSLHDLEENRFAAASLYNRLANICSDISSRFLTSTSMFKQLTGEDAIEAETKYKPRFKFLNFAKMLFACNAVPDVADESSAFFDRWIIIDFPNKFIDGVNADPNILDKLTTPTELSGLLNLALAGLKRLLEKKRFSNVKTEEERRRDYQRKASPIYAFVEDCLTVDSGSMVAKDVLYEEFVKYCRVNGLPAVSRDTFFRVLPRKIACVADRVMIDGKRQYVIKGIRIEKRVEETSKRLEEAASVE